jgi:hypothetical protein
MEQTKSNTWQFEEAERQDFCTKCNHVRVDALLVQALNCVLERLSQHLAVLVE